MNVLLISPLAPALLFFAGTLIVLLLNLNLRQRQVSPHVKSTIGLGIVGAIFLLLAARIALGLNSGFSDPPLVLATWGTGDSLTIRLDGLSMAFLFVPVLLLLASFWGQQITDYAALLALGGSAATVFIAANGIGFSYALLMFDLLGSLYWLHHQQRALALARLFLSVLTTGALMLAGLSATATIGGGVLALALWLRLGLFPFVETNIWAKAKLAGAEAMVWIALSTAIGVYVTARFLRISVPMTVQVLVGVTVLLNASLAWLGSSQEEGIRKKLLRMSITQPGLVLLISPLPASVAIALGLGYTLALGALWLTPRVGRPNFLERHWLWIYAAPVLATVTVVGFPFTFGWVAHYGLYTNLLQHNRQGILALVLVAEGLGFSVLYHYWRILLAGQDKKEVALWTALMLTIPFLLPGVAGVTFNVITGLPFVGFATGQNQSLGVTTLLNLALVWALATGLGYGRPFILRQLSLSPETIEIILRLSWLWPVLQTAANWGRWVVLRFKAIVEGEHYLGWAFLMTLIGILVVILQ